jgi:DTW domain-containing protein YfiP
MLDKQKISRLRKTIDPCQVCFLHQDRCICSQIPKLELKTKLSLIIHAKELKRTTNTGRLAVQALVNSEMLVRGIDREKLDLSSILSKDYESVVLYPAADAIALSTLKPRKPIHLIVSDGNWRQANKINSRHPELQHLPRVKVTLIGPQEKTLGGSQDSQPQSQPVQRLRKEHVEGGLSTLEAIALAIAAIEGDEVGKVLMNLYRAKLSATLIGRGIKPNDFQSSQQNSP